MSDGSERAALYARVSSEQQAEAGTIASQVEALRGRVVADGLPLESELEFIDEGYSGATLVRPALERLRDLAAGAVFDRLYVHCPDRLARKYAYQVLLIDELQRCGVQVEFLNHGVGETAEEQLLLQVQGMVAEYERAKIMERCRRGKLHAGRRGSVNVLSGAPYGYRYVRAAEGGARHGMRLWPSKRRWCGRYSSGLIHLRVRAPVLYPTVTALGYPDAPVKDSHRLQPERKLGRRPPNGNANDHSRSGGATKAPTGASLAGGGAEKKKKEI